MPGLKAGSSEGLLDFGLEEIRENQEIDGDDADFAEHQEDAEMEESTEQAQSGRQETQADQNDGENAGPFWSLSRPIPLKM